MNKPWVKIVIALMLGALIGSVAVMAPAWIEIGKHNHAVLNDMLVNPAYVAVDYIETQEPGIVVLNVFSPHERKSGYSIIWVYVAPEAGGKDRLVPILRVCLEGIREAWPTAKGYSVVFAQPEKITTIDGVHTRIRMIASYAFTGGAVRRFLEDPTIETLDKLFNRGTFVFTPAYWTVALREVLPRLTGYVWPWQIVKTAVTPVPCETCE